MHSSPVADTTPERKFYTVAEAAVVLGVTTKTLYRWVKDGRIPYIKLGLGPNSSIRIPIGALEGMGQDHDEKGASDDTR